MIHNNFAHPKFHITHSHFSLLLLYFNSTVFCLFPLDERNRYYVLCMWYSVYMRGMHNIDVHIYIIENRKHIRTYAHTHTLNRIHSIQCWHFCVHAKYRFYIFFSFFLDLNDDDDESISFNRLSFNFQTSMCNNMLYERVWVFMSVNLLCNSMAWKPEIWQHNHMASPFNSINLILSLFHPSPRKLNKLNLNNWTSNWIVHN